MGRIGITQSDVYQAAQAIAEAGDFPTIQSVHAKLGTGSLGTIHKHLLAWKQERLLKPAIKIESGKDALKVKNIVTEKLELEKIVQRQVEQNAVLSAQLLNLEQENIALKTKLDLLEVKIAALNTERAELTNKVIQHDMLVTELKTSHLAAMQLILQDKNIEIESLKTELKTVHLASMELVRKTSFESQDLLMSERVKNINLGDQLKALTARIKQLDQRSIINSKVTKTWNEQNPAHKKLKSYTLDEIYAQKSKADQRSDEDIA